MTTRAPNRCRQNTTEQNRHQVATEVDSADQTHLAVGEAQRLTHRRQHHSKGKTAQTKACEKANNPGQDNNPTVG